MAIRTKRVIETFLAGDLRHAESTHTRPLCLTLPPKPGMPPSDKTPVRIYLGTEAVQFRAERAFVWSVERVRDPARQYEIYLMRDFVGYERRLWLTGFTNYRFAIPELAGGRGRAIYNDADQIYLHDPADLFDADMGDAGVLSINDRDTSVMLIDCEKMIGLWNGRTARGTGNRELEKQMRNAHLWAAIDGAWNARDAEYVPGESRVVHYTTIHSQPWRPTPQDYIYRANPAADIWLTIEREADAAGFQLFGPGHTSPAFAARPLRQPVEKPLPAHMADFRRLVDDARAASLIYCGYDDPQAITQLASAPSLDQKTIATLVPEALANGVPGQTAEVVLAAGLAELPDLDIPWILDSLFERAQRALLVAITLNDGSNRATPADELWWYSQLVAAGARYPNRHWRLIVLQPRFAHRHRVWRWSGGALLSANPTVWTLLHYKTGHRSQALGVAEALGWPFETRDIVRDRKAHGLAFLRDQIGLGRARWPGGINPPWPDVVVASGWLPSVIARAVAARNHANTRLVLMGRRGGRVDETQNIGLVCRHFDLPPNPRELSTTLPPSKVAEKQLAAARRRWTELYGDEGKLRVVMLVGGHTPQHVLTADAAWRMAADVRQAVEDEKGELAVLTSRRTPADAAAAIREAAGSQALFEGWNSQAGEANPYLGYLASADVLVVTGESESMLAEAVATGKPVYILPLAERAPDARRRLADWVVRQAGTDRFNARGSRRPQEGLQYICARLVQKRVFVPRRNMPALHDALIDQGVARIFNGRLERWTPPVWHETDWVAQRIRAMLPIAGTQGRPRARASSGPRSAHG
ncbi:MAG: ELM1/GtrOC1 family putative glycosyltransferase [Salinisphaera sp.]|jgi:mitochondrial fission protein ELM1|nr:ELM1/GtrOC1 family putative glycosyltransferase [Salinisphaera sp.]